MNGLSDAELIVKFRHGQVQAFNMLVWRWQKPMLNFLYRFLGNQQDAEDVSQKLFMKVHHKISGLKDVDKFRVWLYQVAANEARDELRKQKRRSLFPLNESHHSDSERDDETAQDIQDGSTNDVEDEVHQNELRNIFEQAIQEIPETQREVVVMKIYQDLKFVEIAEILQESINTVKSRMYYGLKALREVLQKNNFSEEVLNNEM